MNALGMKLKGIACLEFCCLFSKPKWDLFSVINWGDGAGSFFCVSNVEGKAATSHMTEMTD